MAKKNFLIRLLQKDKKSLSGMTITITQDGQSSDSPASSGATTTSGSGIRPLPLIGGLTVRNQYLFAGVTLLVSFFLAGAVTFIINNKKNAYVFNQTSFAILKQHVNDLQTDVYKVSLGIDTFAPNAYLDQMYIEDDFVFMRSALFPDMKTVSGGARDALDIAWREWLDLKVSRDELVKAHIALLTVRSKFASSRAGVDSALVNMRELSLTKDELSAENLSNLNQLISILVRLKSRVDVSDANVSYKVTANDFQDIISEIPRKLSNINIDEIGDDELKARLVSSIAWLKAFVPATIKVNSLLLDFEKSRVSAYVLSGGASRVSQLVDYAEQELSANFSVYEKLNWLAGVFSVMALVSMVILALINNNEGKRRTFEEKNENEANQRAIMSLLDEIANLADGDLTVRATVTEQITGAIADSVNFAISEMGGLVTAIKSASSQISDAAGTALTNSTQLLEISNKQSKDITETGKSVLLITEAIEQVSKRMEDSKKVAQSSVDSSARGLEAVNTSIAGIKSIRENVDETGKRIKRLTEQSLQISEIVELIGDISERTSVLAINATVQATKAGAAGKGFKVVADAVQELANQASEATRRIGALINAIQTDIQGAGAAMQKTTDEALRGEVLAESTGEVLAEINDVSLALADIVADVNEQIGNSARSAADVSQTMKRVLESVTESTDATKATGEAVGAINKLTEQLRESVSGFQI